jgi:glutathione S-transferase
MPTLYHCVSARSFRPLWTLEELQAPYALKMLPFPPRALQRSYLDINVLGTVPFLEDGDQTMTESAAMCQYLAETQDPDNRLGLWVGRGERDHAHYLNWLHHGEATLTFPQTLVLRYGRFEPPERRQPQVAEDYGRWFLARLRAIAARLEHQSFLAADRFTAADVSVGYALMLGELVGLSGQYPASVQAYWERLRQRPGHLRALAAQEQAAQAQGVAVAPATV